MPRFEPFTGIRYDPSILLDDVIAPPYDVVGADERAKLASRHRANSIHVELPEDDPERGLDRYSAAAALFASWTEEGLLRRDDAPALYSYRMTDPAGHATTGVIGALACETSEGDILPHEQTIPKDMSDRLNLLRACHANLSPIWGLSLTGGLAETYDPSGAPEREAIDDDGVLHQLWVIDDPARIDPICRGVARSPVVIADGHHRYETAVTYQAERRGATGDVNGDYDLVMALVVELAEHQLAVGAIHRVLNGLPGDVDLARTMGRWFDCERAGDPGEDLARDLVDSGRLTLVTREGIWTMEPRPETYATAGSDLDSSIVALALEGITGVTVTYNHDRDEAVRSVGGGNADAAVLIRPVTVAQISDWAHARRRMPPKSTYFHPKPRTGMVFRPVEG